MKEQKYKVKWRSKLTGHEDGAEFVMPKDVAEKAMKSRIFTHGDYYDHFLAPCDDNGNEIEGQKK